MASQSTIGTSAALSTTSSTTATTTTAAVTAAAVRELIVDVEASVSWQLGYW